MDLDRRFLLLVSAMTASMSAVLLLKPVLAAVRAHHPPPARTAAVAPPRRLRPTGHFIPPEGSSALSRDLYLYKGLLYRVWEDRRGSSPVSSFRVSGGFSPLQVRGADGPVLAAPVDAQGENAPCFIDKERGLIETVHRLSGGEPVSFLRYHRGIADVPPPGLP